MTDFCTKKRPEEYEFNNQREFADNELPIEVQPLPINANVQYSNIPSGPSGPSGQRLPINASVQYSNIPSGQSNEQFVEIRHQPYQYVGV